MFFLKRVWPVERIIDNAKKEIPSTLGDDLNSLILHGPHAEAESSCDTSTPISLLIVLHAVTPDTLNRLASAFKRVRGNAQLNPMVLTLGEIHASTDVFPITFMEMKRCHRLLAGKDVLEGLLIQPGHLRLRCEQETKNLLFRMQRDYLVTHENPKRLRQTLQRDLAAFARTMRAALTMCDTDASYQGSQVLVSTAKTFQLDADLAHRLTEFSNDTAAIHRDLLGELFLASIDFVSQVATAIDELPHTFSDVELFEEMGGTS